MDLLRDCLITGYEGVLTELMINGFIIGARSRKYFVKLGRLGKEFGANVKGVAKKQHCFGAFFFNFFNFLSKSARLFLFFSGQKPGTFIDLASVSLRKYARHFCRRGHRGLREFKELSPQMFTNYGKKFLPLKKVRMREI